MGPDCASERVPIALAAKPPASKSTRRAPWRPATRPPNKAAGTVNLLRQIAANEMAARSMLRPQPR